MHLMYRTLISSQARFGKSIYIKRGCGYNCCFRILTRFYLLSTIESFLRLAPHRSYVVILLLSIVRLQYFCHWIRKFSEIVKIESSLRGDDLSRKGLSHQKRALLLFSGIQLRLMSAGDVSDADCTCALAQCPRVGDSVLNKFSVQHCRAGHCPRPICAPTRQPALSPPISFSFPHSPSSSSPYPAWHVLYSFWKIDELKRNRRNSLHV